MRILIVSDLHANLEAVRSLPERYDEMWVLGDLVNYGPNPCSDSVSRGSFGWHGADSVQVVGKRSRESKLCRLL